MFNQLNSDWVKKYIPVGIIALFVLNALILDAAVFLKKPVQSENNSQPTISTNQPALCPQSCSDLINTSLLNLGASSSAAGTVINLSSGSTITSLQKTPTPTLNPTPTIIPTYTPVPLPTNTPTPSPTPTPLPKVKEFFIPLGSGFSSATDWAVVNGIGATINLANYTDIDKIYFEITVRIPNGNQTVYVRLYNSNSYQSVDGSELNLSSGTPTLLTSNSINLSYGSNTYQVQMKTQLGFQTHVDQARIRILTK